ncbi:MAG: hypothetical protein Q8S84_02110 [bacterium]|nr:hypothetical protein [bacterium]MDP3380350.1 hypothetical protein [bacterium]
MLVFIFPLLINECPHPSPLQRERGQYVKKQLSLISSPFGRG